VKQVEDVIKANEKISAKIIKIDEKGRIDLSLKQMEAPPSRPSRPSRPPRNSRSSSRENESSGPETFEKKLSSFLKLSETKIADLNNRANNARSGKKRSKKSK
jgi:S1 RNA binding domain protein